MKAFSFQQLEDGRQIECAIYPSAQLKAGLLFKSFDESEFVGCHLLEDGVLDALQQAEDLMAERSADSGDNEAATEGEAAVVGELAVGDESQAKPAAVEPLLRFVVAERQDAMAAVNVSSDRMLAELAITSARGGRQMLADDITALLKADGVCKGIDEQAVAELLSKAAEGSAGSHFNGIVARGRRPRPGVPSAFRCLVVPFQERVLVPQEQEDGSVDMHDLGDIDSVRVGDVLMEREPAHPGDDGYDVLGKVLASETPRETAFKPGKGTEISADNPHHLVATRAGIPHKRGIGMEVDDVLVVQDVDLKVGNINYEGSVLVKGDVHADMRIEAEGDLAINGFVENADILCGGDLIVRNGIIGRTPGGNERNDDGPLRCRVSAQNITARYAQHAMLDAAETVSMQAQMLYCHARCRTLEVGGERQKRSAIIGGEVRSRELVAVGVAGAEAATRTRIYLDLGLEEFAERLENVSEELTKLKWTLRGLSQSVEKMQKLPQEKVDQDKLGRARNTVSKLKDDVLGKQSERQSIHDELGESRDSVRFTVFGRVFPGVELHFLDVDYHFKGEMTAGTLGISELGWAVVD